MEDYKLLINGDLVDGASTMEVINPATEEILAHCPRASVAQANAAVEAADAAFPNWAATPIAERRSRILKLADLLAQEASTLARLLTQEQGKPLPESTAEIAYTEAFVRHLATYDLPVQVLEDGPTRRVEVHRKPVGVVAAIIPWNFPILLISFKLPPALLAGNTIVIKPAPTTPLTTLKFGELDCRCQRSRTGAHAAPESAQDQHDRLDRDRPQGDGQRRQPTETRDTGTRRQRRRHRARRYRCESRRPWPVPERVHELRPGLHRPETSLCARESL
jgi:hypothetical protein